MAYLLNIEREKLAVLKEIAAKERTTIKAIIEDGVDDYIKKHGKSNNPQTQIEQFDKASILAIPNPYRDIKTWQKFYDLSLPRFQPVLGGEGRSGEDAVF